MRRHSGLVMVIALVTLAACRTERRSTISSADSSAMAAEAERVVVSGTPFVIHTTKSAIDLGLANDTVYMTLSDSIRAKARAEMDTSATDESSGFGRALSNVIRKTVNKALGTRVAYAVSELNGARYEDGTIKFDYRNKHRFSFESVKTDNRTALADFHPADAERFVAVVNAAIQADRAGAR